MKMYLQNTKMCYYYSQQHLSHRTIKKVISISSSSKLMKVTRPKLDMTRNDFHQSIGTEISCQHFRQYCFDL